MEAILIVWFGGMAVLTLCFTLAAVREVRQKFNVIKRGGTGWES